MATPASNDGSPVDQLLSEYEQLLERRARLLSAHADVWAKFGPYGTAFLRRNVEEMRLRKKFRESGEIDSEQALKEEVFCSERWAKVVDALESGRRVFFEQKGELEITARRLGLLTARIRLAGLSIGDINSNETSSQEGPEGG